MSSSRTDKPRPLKAIGNLTTPISTLRFNHDSQLLAMASSAKKDQMRLVCPRLRLDKFLPFDALTDPPPLAHCFCQLANFEHTSEPRHIL
jgi:hypothetical protein